MKKSGLVLLVLLVASGVFAQTVKEEIVDNLTTNLGVDMTILFTGIGNEVVPKLQQASLSANIVGDAEIGRFPHFTLTLAGLGVNVYDGLGGFITDPNTDWQSDIVNVGELVSDATADFDLYDLATQQAFPLPSVRLGFGMGIADGYEILTGGFFIPDIVLGIARDQVDQLSALNASVSNLSLRVRKTIVGREERRGRSFSIGAGYTYSGFELGYTVNSLFDLTDEPVTAIENSLWAEVYDTNINVATNIHTLGLDFHVARRWPVVTTFLKVSPYIQTAKYKAEVNLNGVVLSEEPTEETVATLVAGAPEADKFTIDVDTGEIEIGDLSVYFNSGFELRFLGIIWHTSLGYNLENPILNLGNTSFDENFDGEVNGLTLNAGLRIQY